MYGCLYIAPSKQVLSLSSALLIDICMGTFSFFYGCISGLAIAVIWHSLVLLIDIRVGVFSVVYDLISTSYSNLTFFYRWPKTFIFLQKAGHSPAHVILRTS